MIESSASFVLPIHIITMTGEHVELRWVVGRGSSQVHVADDQGYIADPTVAKFLATGSGPLVDAV